MFKKLILSILIIFLLPSLCFSGALKMDEEVIARKNAGGGACSGSCATSKDSELAATTGYRTVGRYDDYVATKFTAGSTYDVCKVLLHINKAGSAVGDITVAIYSDDTDEPGTIIGTWSDAINAATFGTGSSETRTFINMCSSVTNTVPYWTVVHSSVVDSSNYARWQLNESGAVEHMMYSADASTWSEDSATETGMYNTYSD